MKIVIPSLGRSETILTHRLLNDYLVCVPDSEHDLYARTIPGDHLIAHPDRVLGIAPKLNWILDNVPDDECIVILDDDIKCMYDLTVTPGQKYSTSKITRPELVEAIIYNTYQMAHQAGVYYFGWAMRIALAYYSDLSPFKLTGYINRSSCGLINGHGLRFEERLTANADYDMALQNAQKHRMVWCDTRYGFDYKDTFVGAGGGSMLRSSETHKRDLQFLKEKWGDHIRIGHFLGGTGKGNKREYADRQRIRIWLPY